MTPKSGLRLALAICVTATATIAAAIMLEDANPIVRVVAIGANLGAVALAWKIAHDALAIAFLDGRHMVVAAHAIQMRRMMEMLDEANSEKRPESRPH